MQWSPPHPSGLLGRSEILSLERGGNRSVYNLSQIFITLPSKKNPKANKLPTKCKHQCGATYKWGQQGGVRGHLICYSCACQEGGELSLCYQWPFFFSKGESGSQGLPGPRGEKGESVSTRTISRKGNRMQVVVLSSTVNFCWWCWCTLNVFLAGPLYQGEAGISNICWYIWGKWIESSLTSVDN